MYLDALPLSSCCEREIKTGTGNEFEWDLNWGGEMISTRGSPSFYDAKDGPHEHFSWDLST